MVSNYRARPSKKDVETVWQHRRICWWVLKEVFAKQFTIILFCKQGFAKWGVVGHIPTFFHFS